MGFLVRLRRLVSDGERRLVRDLGAFGAVGGISFAIDLALFQVLYAHVGTGAVTAKLTAGLVATTFAFLGHRFWSFARRARTGLRREYPLFVLVNALTLMLSLAIVAVVRYPLGQESSLVLQAANVVAIFTGTVVRFVSYRRWVFPARTSAVPPDRSATTAPGQPLPDLRARASGVPTAGSPARFSSAGQP